MPWRHMGEWMFRSTFSWPRHYLVASAKFHATATLLPGKEPLDHTGWRLGSPQNMWVLHGERKFLPLPGLKHQTFSRPTCSYTNCTIPLPPNIAGIHYYTLFQRISRQSWSSDHLSGCPSVNASWGTYSLSVLFKWLSVIPLCQHFFARLL
jgi:hypothetical protein